MSRIERAVGSGSAFIPYLVAGDPHPAATATFVEALDNAGAAAIELGLPFSEPVAEGPTIQRGIERALEAGMTPTRYFDLVDEIDIDAPLICMTYYNLVYRFGDSSGPAAFIERCGEVGIDGVIIPDLPVEEAGPLIEACDRVGVDPVFIVAPTTTKARLEHIRRHGAGFVYVQARLGTTGASDRIDEVTRRSIDRVADWDRPAAVGFGISTGEQAAEVIEAGADGVIVGSALIDTIAEGLVDGDSVVDIADILRGQAGAIAVGASCGDRRLDEAVRKILRSASDRPVPETAVSVSSRGFERAIIDRRAEGDVPIIAEVKRTSPTTDNYRDDDAAVIATELVRGGATAVSVLTESTHFGGSTQDLDRVRSAVDVPVLRKDFILDVTELDRVEADAVLLIARFVDDLNRLIEGARSRGMEPLVEVHTEAELDRAHRAGASLIGINNRDLETLTVDLGTVESLAPLVRDDATLIAESGITTPDDVERMLDAGADGLLIGSAIMDGDVRTNLERLRGPSIGGGIEPGVSD